MQNNNLTHWFESCTDNGRMRQVLIYYFALPDSLQSTLFDTIICPTFQTNQTLIDQKLCGGPCSESQFYFKQFSSANISKDYFNSATLANITNAHYYVSLNNLTIEFPSILKSALVNAS